MPPFTPLNRTAPWVLALGLTSAACQSPKPGSAVRVAAAADLSGAFAEAGLAFEASTGHKVIFTFGSSGLLARQISLGAPFDVFAAASQQFAEQTVRARVCDAHSMAGYARGRLALWGRPNLPWVPMNLNELADPRVARIAIANPEHAPYGLAAKQALEQMGLWQRLQPKLVMAENVRQAMQFANSGNADVALVARSLVIAGQGRPPVLIDEALHQPIQQTLVVCRGGGQTAAGQAFARFLLSAPGQAILQRHGFSKSGE